MALDLKRLEVEENDVAEAIEIPQQKIVLTFEEIEKAVR